MLEVNATLHVLQICVIEKKKEMCAEVTFVQQIGNAMCSFTYPHEYLQLASNAILLKKRKKKKPSDQQGFKLTCKRKHFSLFTIVLSGEFHMDCF